MNKLRLELRYRRRVRRGGLVLLRLELPGLGRGLGGLRVHRRVRGRRRRGHLRSGDRGSVGCKVTGSDSA